MFNLHVFDAQALGRVVRSRASGILRALVGTVLVASASHSDANNTTADQYQELYMKFENGDSAAIVCNANRTDCNVKIKIFGQTYAYAQSELSDIEEIGAIVPDRFALVRRSELRKDFDFVVRYWCSDKVLSEKRSAVCIAIVSVEGGAVASIDRYGKIESIFDVE